LLPLSYRCQLFIPTPPTTSPLPYATLFRSVKPAAKPMTVTTSRATHNLTSLLFDFCFLLHSVAISESPPHSSGLGKRLPRYPSTDRKSTRLNSSHVSISYAVFCLKKINK